MEREDPENWLTAKDDQVPANCFGGGHELARKELHRLFFKRPDGQKVRVVGHNFKADLARLIPWGLDLTELFEAPEDDPGVGIDPNAVEGWVKTALEGGFDTMLALHAVHETADMKLEVCCSRLLENVDRWDGLIQKRKKEWCKAKGIPEKELEGYGPFPFEDLGPYSKYDVDCDRELFDRLNEPGGLLDQDRFGNCSRLPFWISMRATTAFMEMEMEGLRIDRQRVDDLTTLYLEVEERLKEKMQELTNWKDFKAGSHPKCRALLFGWEMARTVDNKTGQPKNWIELADKVDPD